MVVGATTTLEVTTGDAVPGSIEVLFATGKGATTLETSGVGVETTSDSTGAAADETGTEVTAAELSTAEDTSTGAAEEGSASTTALLVAGAAVEEAATETGVEAAGVSAAPPVAVAAGAPASSPKVRS
jgi:hypothetical protein